MGSPRQGEEDPPSDALTATLREVLECAWRLRGEGQEEGHAGREVATLARADRPLSAAAGFMAEKIASSKKAFLGFGRGMGTCIESAGLPGLKVPPAPIQVPPNSD